LIIKNKNQSIPDAANPNRVEEVDLIPHDGVIHPIKLRAKLA
jgi:hypothetical protein